MPATPSNIVLIGMPGAGKSTLGVILAKLSTRRFVDTDLLIQTSKNKSLQELVDSEGYLALRRAEEEVLLGLTISNAVIATGGSAVYSQRAMAHLQQDGLLVFLDVPLEVLTQRVRDYTTRGLAKPAEQSFEAMFAERLALYRSYAGLTIPYQNLPQEAICAEILDKIRQTSWPGR